MKTKNALYNKMTCLIILVVLFMGTSCEEEPAMEEAGPSQGETFIENWQELITSMQPSGDILFVENTQSLGHAVSSAKPGDMLIIEGGQYVEEINISDSGIEMYGIQNEHGENVQTPNLAFTESAFKNTEQIKVPFTYSKGAISGKSNGDFQVESMSREVLSANIVHYTFDLRVGPGEYDVVTVHRVVKEGKAYKPLRTKGDIFMIHGASQNFVDIFIAAGGGDVNKHTALPAYLANNNIDVWGISLGWTKVPLETSDFGFMMDWGVERDSEHTRKAMAFARMIRVLTGSGFGPLNLLGFSYGAFVGYDAAGDETQLNMYMQHIKGLIPADQSFKYAPEAEEYRLIACALAQVAKDNIAGGVYFNPQGLNISAIGNLALGDPDGPTPIPDFQPLGLTNQGVAIFLGANTYFPGGSAAPFWHFAAGNGNGPFEIATDLKYTDVNRWVNLLADLPPYMPEKTGYDVRACLCDEEDVSIDDYLGLIDVPIFTWSAGGGNGGYSEYSATLTASSDISSYVVSLFPERYGDFGHADLFIANNAKSEAWPSLLSWLKDH